MLRNVQYLLVFAIGGHRCALPHGGVERVLPAAELTRLPGAPGVVAGILNYRGRLLPVVDLRPRFGVPKQAMGLSDTFVLVHTSRRQVLIWADTVEGLIQPESNDVIPAAGVVPGLEGVQGVVRLSDGGLLIHDLDAFLSLAEEQQLDEALQSQPVS